MLALSEEVPQYIRVQALRPWLALFRASMMIKLISVKYAKRRPCTVGFVSMTDGQFLTSKQIRERA